MNLQTKQDLRAMLAEQVQQYQAQGHEITRYASLSSMNVREKIKTGVQPKVTNLKQQEWDDFLKSVEDGTYQADSFKQEPLEQTRDRFMRLRTISGR